MNSCFYLLTSTHNVSLMYHNEKHRTHGPRWLLALVHREKHLHIKSAVDVSCMGLASVHCLRVAVERFFIWEQNVFLDKRVTDFEVVNPRTDSMGSHFTTEIKLAFIESIKRSRWSSNGKITSAELHCKLSDQELWKETRKKSGTSFGQSKVLIANNMKQLLLVTQTVNSHFWRQRLKLSSLLPGVGLGDW